MFSTAGALADESVRFSAHFFRLFGYSGLPNEERRCSEGILQRDALQRSEVAKDAVACLGLARVNLGSAPLQSRTTALKEPSVFRRCLPFSQKTACATNRVITVWCLPTTYHHHQSLVRYPDAQIGASLGNRLWRFGSSPRTQWPTWPLVRCPNPKFQDEEGSVPLKAIAAPTSNFLSSKGQNIDF